MKLDEVRKYVLPYLAKGAITTSWIDGIPLMARAHSCVLQYTTSARRWDRNGSTRGRQNNAVKPAVRRCGVMRTLYCVWSYGGYPPAKVLNTSESAEPMRHVGESVRKTAEVVPSRFAVESVGRRHQPDSVYKGTAPRGISKVSKDAGREWRLGD